MTAPKTPVIGHVTPLPGNGEPVKYAGDGAWEVVRRGPGVDTSGRIDRALDMRTVRMTTPITEPAVTMTVETRGHDGLVRPGPESYVEGCPSNECQIRRQCTGATCRMASPQTPLPADSLFSLESARALLARTEHAEPNPEHQADLWVELREACDEVERLRGAKQTAALAAGFDVGQHARDLERQVEALTADLATKASALEAETAEHIACAEELRIANAKVDETKDELTAQEQRTAVVLESRNAYRDRLRRILGVTKPDGEDLVGLVASEIGRLTKERDVWQLMARARLETIAKAERSRDTWQRRARKAESRIAELEAAAEALAAERDDLVEERDGLTLRLGAMVKRLETPGRRMHLEFLGPAPQTKTTRRNGKRKGAR